MTMEYVIGVDAGGTKTVAWIADAERHLVGSPIARADSGPGNIRSAGFETATANIQTAIREVTAGIPLPVRTLCICGAGAGRRGDQTRLQEWAESLSISDGVLVRTDAEAVLAAVSFDRTGVALIAGTGSLAWGRNAVGETHRAGGWGHLLGDEGSAFDIARTALQYVSQMADGRRERTQLLPSILQALKLQDASELVPTIYGTNQSKHQIAMLAGQVFKCAAEGDANADDIITGAAESLFRMVATVAERLNLSDDYPLAVTGGVLIHQDAFRQRLLNMFHRSGEAATLVEQPVEGAVALALAASK